MEGYKRDELGNMRKKAAVAWFEALLQHYTGQTEENYQTVSPKTTLLTYIWDRDLQNRRQIFSPHWRYILHCHFKTYYFSLMFYVHSACFCLGRDRNTQNGNSAFLFGMVLQGRNVNASEQKIRTLWSLLIFSASSKVPKWIGTHTNVACL
jgi:hypothetical protein